MDAQEKEVLKENDSCNKTDGGYDETEEINAVEDLPLNDDLNNV